LAYGLHRDGCHRRTLDDLVVSQLSPPQGTSENQRPGAPSYLPGCCRRSWPANSLATTSSVQADLGVRSREIFNRPDLVFLPLLATFLFQLKVSSRPLASRSAAHYRLQHFRHRQHWRWLAAVPIPAPRAFNYTCEARGHASLRSPRSSYLHRFRC